MNLVIGILGTNIILSTVSSVSCTIDNINNVLSSIRNNTNNGELETINMIEETNLEVKTKLVHLLVCELNIHDYTPYTVKYCIHEINKNLTIIKFELDNINKRVQYNNSLWFGKSVRSYKFHNAKNRLTLYLNNLESLYTKLINILTIEHKLTKNEDTHITRSTNSIL